jgi:uroporphyrinogen-III decarboxylase
MISDLPPKSTIWFFDQTDMHRAKDVLGDHFCLMGNVPISMIKAGTADQVTEYCKDLIDYCGRGGGFILSPGCQIDQGKEETVRALIDVAKEHLPS